MRSEENLWASPSRRRAARWITAAVMAVVACSGDAAPAPQSAYDDEPLLATAISHQDVELRGRYARQTRDPDGTLILMFNGGFQMDMGRRRLSAGNAVVWIRSARTAPEGRRYHDLTVYLSEDAEVIEPGGTVTVDNVLLVRGLRTTGQIVKLHDAHAEDGLAETPLYQQALRDRAHIESGAAFPAEAAPAVVRPHEARRGGPERSPRVIRYRLPSIEPAETRTGEKVFVSTGGVYFSQDGGPSAPMLEIRADSAVVFPMPGSATSLFDADVLSEEAPATQPAAVPEDEPAPGAPPVEPGPLGLGGAKEAARIQSVYLEGDVVLSLGNRFVRASRLYYDFERDRALILDAVFRTDVPQRSIPLYVRADEIRQLSATEVSARHAVVTTSEFYTPSYHVGAERIVLRDATARDAEGRAIGPLTGNYELDNATLNVEGVPLLWWPYSAGTLQQSETLIRRVRTGYSSDRGAELETSWYLFNLLGIRAPEGYDGTFRLDGFTKRGPATGLDFDYEREDHFGLLRSYFIYDEGEDNLGPLRRRHETPDSSERGRILWRHRHYLPYDWEATLELAYHSDPHFLEEYERSEYREGKDQETALYLKRARETEALTFLANWRLPDQLSQTEHLPEVAYRRIGDTFASPLVLYHESRLGGVRYRPAGPDADGYPYWLYQNRITGWPGRRGAASDVTFRGDLRQEAELPLKLGPVNVVPFGSVRGSYWDGQPRDDGGLWRGLGVYGVRGGTSFSRVFDTVESELLDIHQIRHVIKPDFAAWWGHSNTRSENITPFDYGVETIDAFYGFTAGVRQVWQTKRGPADNRRTVDLLTLNLEVGCFGNTEGREDFSNGYADPLRPENSRTRNYVAGDLIYRLSDTTSVLYDFNIDLNDGAFDRHNVALAVERSPRLAYVAGWRSAGDIDMSLIGGGWNYKLNPKHITAFRGWYDVDGGDLGEVTISYVRKLPRWYLGLTFEYDNLEDEFSISVALWPEGIPEWAIGSRRFTPLGDSTGIRP